MDHTPLQMSEFLAATRQSAPKALTINGKDVDLHRMYEVRFPEV